MMVLVLGDNFEFLLQCSNWSKNDGYILFLLIILMCSLAVNNASATAHELLDCEFFISARIF